MLVTPQQTATHSDRWRVIDTNFPPWIAYMTFRNKHTATCYRSASKAEFISNTHAIRQDAVAL